MVASEESRKKTGEWTILLRRWSNGEQEAFERLMDLAYPELRRIARVQFARERMGHTLEPTALLHEACIRLMGQKEMQWESRSQLCGVMAMMMRRILVDHARAKKQRKRGGGAVRVTLTEGARKATPNPVDVMDVDRALTKLEKLDPFKARVVELRYFGGLEETETAELLGVSRSSVQRAWRFSRAWLQRELHRSSKE